MIWRIGFAEFQNDACIFQGKLTGETNKQHVSLYNKVYLLLVQCPSKGFSGQGTLLHDSPPPDVTGTQVPFVMTPPSSRASENSRISQ